MAGKTDTMANAFIDYVTGNITDFNAAVPRPFELGLLTTNPTDNTPTGVSAAVEVSDANYARITLTTSEFAAASGGSVSNQIIMEFGGASGFAGPHTLTGFAIWDSGGTMRLWDAISASVSAGQRYRIPIGNYTHDED